MHRLSSVLPNVLHRRGYAEQAQAALMTFKARQWIEEHFAPLRDCVQVRMIKEGELIIACTHSIALQEVQAASEQMLQYLRQECPLVKLVGVRIARA